MNKKKTIFSIITVSKDNFDGLNQTYSSIKKINFKQFEWVVILKGNCKKSISLIKSEKKIQKKIIINKDKNLWDAMNIGVINSIGEYLIFMNAGDCFLKKNILNKIQKIILKERAPDVIYGNTIEKINNKKKFKKSLNHKFIHYGMFANHQSFFFKKTCIKKYRKPFDYKKFKFTADYALIAKLYNSRKIFFQTNLYVSIFLFGGMSYSKQYLTKSRKEQIFIKQKILNMNVMLVYFIYFIQKLLWLIRLYFNPIYKLIRYK